MNTGFIFHIPDDLLEEYALGRVPDRGRTPVEEHLLICPTCQNNLAEIDEYIGVMKTALDALPPLPPKRLSVPRRNSSLVVFSRSG